MARHGLEATGLARQARHGLYGHGADGHGLAGMERSVWDERGGVRHGRHGAACSGTIRRGRRGKALFGLEGTGEDWRGMAGMARLGIAW
jgi:hypothetical protein